MILAVSILELKQHNKTREDMQAKALAPPACWCALAKKRGLSTLSGLIMKKGLNRSAIASSCR